MHDSNDFDAVSMTAKENTKGEGPQQTASDIAFHLGKQGRVDANARDTVFERGEKPLAEISLISFVPGSGSDQFSFCLRMEKNRGHFSAA